MNDQPTFVRIVAALAWFGVVTGWGIWIAVRLRRTRGHSRWGRFLAYWASVTGYTVGLVGPWVLLPDDGRRYVGGRLQVETPSNIGWVEGLGFALVGGLLLAIILTWYTRGTALDQPDPRYEAFPDEFVADVLADEPDMSPDERRRTALALVDEAEQSGQRLPHPLRTFVKRYAPERLGRASARRT